MDWDAGWVGFVMLTIGCLAAVVVVALQARDIRCRAYTQGVEDERARAEHQREEEQGVVEPEFD